jgi:hypothetical protein
MTQSKKQKDLYILAKLRQSKTYKGYKSISDYANGLYECDYVSPYSKSAHNVDAEVFIILQDWSSDENMSGEICKETNLLGYTPSRGSNKNLIKLLKENLNLELKDTYATNLFPYIKMGKMSATIKSTDMSKAAKEFTLPMIDIIKPKIAIALGMETFNALRKSCDLKPAKNMTEAVEFTFTFSDTTIFFQAHPSQQSQNTRTKVLVTKDWECMADFLDSKR